MTRTLFARTAVALSISAFAAAASAALPPFTLNTAGGPVTADNIIVSDYSTVTLSGATFAETGVLAVTSFELGSTIVSTPGLNNGSGLYFQFTGAGSTSPGNPSAVPTSGSFTSLDYSLYQYVGAASFTPGGAVVTGTTTQVAHGSLIQGGVFTQPLNPSFTAGAFASLNFVVDDAAFFVSPTPFYPVAVSAFINTPTQVTPTANGFTITQGGGSVNFAAAVPEPETYAMMFAGLAVMGFVARRRKAD